MELRIFGILVALACLYSGRHHENMAIYCWPPWLLTLFFVFLLKNTASWGGSNEYPQSMFWAEIWKKYQNFYLKIFSFWGEIFNIFE